MKNLLFVILGILLFSSCTQDEADMKVKLEIDFNDLPSVVTNDQSLDAGEISLRSGFTNSTGYRKGEDTYSGNGEAFTFAYQYIDGHSSARRRQFTVVTVDGDVLKGEFDSIYDVGSGDDAVIEGEVNKINGVSGYSDYFKINMIDDALGSREDSFWYNWNGQWYGGEITSGNITLL